MLLLLGWCALMAFIRLCVYAKMTAYDCGPNKTEKTLTVSIHDPFKCKELSQKIMPQKVYINILHENELELRDTYQCKVRKTYLKTGCGVSDSHMYALPNGFYVENVVISEKRCQQMHVRHTIEMDGQSFIVEPNKVNLFNYVIGNQVTSIGKCSNKTPVTQVILEVTLRRSFLTMSGGVPKLPRPAPGNLIQRIRTHRYDPDFGTSYWKNTSTCPASYTKLYQGYAMKYHSNTYNTTIYYSRQKDQEFAIPVRKDVHEICSKRFVETIYPNLYIYTGRANFATRGLRAGRNFRSTEFEAARLIVELDFLREKLKSQECLMQKLEKQLLPLMATATPEEVAYVVMRKFGYTSVRSEKTIDIMKCEEVNVELRNTSKCYDVLPVLHNKKHTFITLKTHVLTENATETKCLNTIPTEL